MKYFSGTIEADSFDEARDQLRPRVGENLKSLREMRELSSEEVAREIGGLSSESLRNYEKGKTGITYEYAWALADFYGVPIGSLGGRIAFEPALEQKESKGVEGDDE